MLRRFVLAAKPRLGGVRLQNRSRGKEKFNPEFELLACLNRKPDNQTDCPNHLKSASLTQTKTGPHRSELQCPKANSRGRQRYKKPLDQSHAAACKVGIMQNERGERQP
uniref:Uncharacterized protein n=1 Tax=Mus musculus TaxID=10090 RepID=Q8C3J6_MOUSE|nr:unnamed protein product [Mus musculus]